LRLASALSVFPAKPFWVEAHCVEPHLKHVESRTGDSINDGAIEALESSCFNAVVFFEQPRLKSPTSGCDRGRLARHWGESSRQPFFFPARFASNHSINRRLIIASLAIRVSNREARLCRVQYR
jgi:hypothetical protein